MKSFSSLWVKIILFCGLFVMSQANMAAAPDKSLYMVAITNGQFVPAVLTVPVGATVMWTNADAIVHTVTAIDKSWNSGQISSGSSYRHVFNKAGTYGYYCDIHPDMHGEVIVSANAVANQ